MYEVLIYIEKDVNLSYYFKTWKETTIFLTTLDKSMVKKLVITKVGGKKC